MCMTWGKTYHIINISHYICTVVRCDVGIDHFFVRVSNAEVTSPIRDLNIHSKIKSVFTMGKG